MLDETWNNLEYRRINRVTHGDGMLHVRFGNGDDVEVEISLLVPSGTDYPDWDRLTFDGTEVEVPTRSGPIYIFWETIRELTDSTYAHHLEVADAQYRLQTGEQIRKLRESRGMTGKLVASRAGINNQSLSRIEHGKRGVTLTTLRRILNAMGYGLSDLVLDTKESEHRTAVG